LSQGRNHGSKVGDLGPEGTEIQRRRHRQWDAKG